jgi:hypothetical protein
LSGLEAPRYTGVKRPRTASLGQIRQACSIRHANGRSGRNSSGAARHYKKSTDRFGGECGLLITVDSKTQQKISANGLHGCLGMISRQPQNLDNPVERMIPSFLYLFMVKINALRYRVRANKDIKACRGSFGQSAAWDQSESATRGSQSHTDTSAKNAD